ncbi:hypothetical protein Fraau_0652 [Frateuria aurantia DSM 6220]|uniref:Uncharacterized protein n=1 Tax=Frateuria aurantia (strain ATCC 33424 / DSM 6220 / KCTC 2777 / LMG 1558 / NBRC 3245 / NCIMB 13370) TaxID=767434 RepID=H8KYJ7_FRAAD|nr:hypothetical protein Fraau_0652 [Frateuria aurantia DSM 6220]
MGLLTMLVLMNLGFTLASGILVARLFWDISRNHGDTVRYPTRRLPAEPSVTHGESNHKDGQTERPSSPP